jgi:hypothetical protein
VSRTTGANATAARVAASGLSGLRTGWLVAGTRAQTGAERTIGGGRGVYGIEPA